MKKTVAPTRDRILKAAKHLFQQRGYFAVGTAEILEAADAPKGSMYHHFPDGKEQIAIEAVTAIRDDVLSLMQRYANEQRSVADSIRSLARGMSSWLKDSAWREGTMLATTTVGSVPDLPKLHAAIKDAFDAWRTQIVSQLVDEGWARHSARAMAQFILSGIEGAMIVARIDQNERAVIDVANSLAEVLDAKTIS